MEDKIITWINMNVTAMTKEEEHEFTVFLYNLELEGFAKESIKS